MTHRGGRSLRARQRRAANKYVMNSGYRDREKAETVNIVQREQILSFLQCEYKNEGVCLDAADFVKGEVLTDSRGHGSLQRTR